MMRLHVENMSLAFVPLDSPLYFDRQDAENYEDDVALGTKCNATRRMGQEARDRPRKTGGGSSFTFREHEQRIKTNVCMRGTLVRGGLKEKRRKTRVRRPRCEVAMWLGAHGWSRRKLDLT